MIRYRVDDRALWSRIAELDTKWEIKARRRSSVLRKRAAYAERSSIWSLIKPAFMELQKYKCAFCERPLAGAEYGAIEHDVEHFRPKSSVRLWPPGTSGFRYSFSTGGAYSNGYYWLAYNIGNYATACKVCNTALKGAYFPIAGRRGRRNSSISILQRELPYLCYPLGTVDSDPESLVTFDATIAVPAKKSGHASRRGRIIIDFFDLNGRAELHRQRATQILLLGKMLQTHDADMVAILTSDRGPHSGCCRAFLTVWQSDRRRARRIMSLCKEALISEDVLSVGP